MQSSQYDAIIIGTGPAGSATAIYLSQAGHKTLAVDKSVTSGATGSHSRINIFPGFPDGISGSDLLKSFHRHAEASGTEFRVGEVNEIAVLDNIKKVMTVDGSRFEARTLVLATGAMDRNYSVQGEKELFGKGVCYSSSLDAPMYKHHAVVVFGKTKEAAEEALHISKYADKIYFAIPSNRLEIPEHMQDQLNNTPRIEQMFSSSLKKINGGEAVTSVTILSAGQEKEIHVKGVFLYTQKNRPLSAYAKDAVKMNEAGCVFVNEEMATSSPGVYACGDILCGILQHPVVTSAQGTIAAMNADKFLR